MAEHHTAAASALPEMNETLFRSVLRRTPARIAFIDRDRIHRYVNPEYASFIGLPIDAILGRSVAEVLGEAAAAQL